MATLKFKRGASFIFTGPVLIGNVVQNMTGWLIRSSIREMTSNGTTDGGVGFAIADLPCVWIDPVLAVAQIGHLSVNTYGWPVGAAVLDIELTSPGGVVVLTESQKIQIVDRVTR